MFRQIPREHDNQATTRVSWTLIQAQAKRLRKQARNLKMIHFTKLNGDSIWVSLNSIHAVEPQKNGVNIFYGRNCVTVKDSLQDILKELKH